MSQLAICLLGPPRLELDGEETRISRRKAIALLVYLAVTGRPHSRDSLATLLWPELDQSTARANLLKEQASIRVWMACDGSPNRSTVSLSNELGTGPVRIYSAAPFC